MVAPSMLEPTFWQQQQSQRDPQEDYIGQTFFDNRFNCFYGSFFSSFRQDNRFLVARSLCLICSSKVIVTPSFYIRLSNNHAVY